MLRCKDITTEAHDLIDNELSLVRRLRVRFHLAICRNCQRYFSQLNAALELLRQSKAADLPQPPTEAETNELIKVLKAANQS